MVRYRAILIIGEPSPFVGYLCGSFSFGGFLPGFVRFIRGLLRSILQSTDTLVYGLRVVRIWRCQQIEIEVRMASLFSPAFSCATPQLK